jgi:DNA-binding NtrC family response regulator
LLPSGKGTGLRRWCEIIFLPVSDANGVLAILGKLAPVASAGVHDSAPLPEKIVALRDRLAQQFTIDRGGATVPAMRRVYEQVRLAAEARSTAFFVGEAGTGKHWLARCAHQLSNRRERSFAVVDCVRLPTQALAEMLFGAAGLRRRLSLGALYIREPARLPRELQDRLCELAAVWRDSPEDDTPLLLAGSCADPQDEVRAGRLLPELLCALGTLVINVPPLRERRDDLDWLVPKLLERAQLATGRSAGGLTESALAAVRDYSWPGNVRELYQVLVGASARAHGDRLDVTDLPFHVRQSAPLPPARPLPLDKLLEEAERRLITLALRQAKNNKAEAAQLLSIWRQRLIRRMEALGID